MKTTTQKNIETMVHLTTENSATIQASKQALYNRIFNAQRERKSVFISGNETKYELLAKYDLHSIITYSALVKLESKGNMVARDLIQGKNFPTNLEDIKQAVYLKFLELDNWDIDLQGRLLLEEDSTALIEVYAEVSKIMYQTATKHYKHQYIEIDGNIVDVNKVTDLADYVSIDNLVKDVHFMTYYNKQSAFDKKWIDYRLQGFSNSAIAKMMNVTYEKIRATDNRQKREWKKYNE